MSYGAIFWLALQTCRERDSAKRAVFVLALVTAGYSVYGLVLYFLDSNAILWFEKWAYEGFLTSTFVNRNTFATFAGLGLLCAVTSGMLHIRSNESGSYVGSSASRRIIRMLAELELTFYFSLAAVLLNGTALLLTASRGGVSATVIAVFVFVAGIALRAKNAGRVAVLAFTVLIVVGGLLLGVSGGHVDERLDHFAEKGFGATQRSIAFKQTAIAIEDYIYLGTGYGTFADVFQAYSVPGIRAYFDYAHNTYLELALEIGLPAAGCLLIAVVLLAWRCFRGLERHSNAYLLAWLGCCATVLVGTHALVDFSVQIPGVACMYALLLGLGCSQSWSVTSKTDLPPSSLVTKRV